MPDSIMSRGASPIACLDSLHGQGGTSFARSSCCRTQTVERPMWPLRPFYDLISAVFVGRFQIRPLTYKTQKVNAYFRLHQIGARTGNVVLSFSLIFENFRRNYFFRSRND